MSALKDHWGKLLAVTLLIAGGGWFASTQWSGPELAATPVQRTRVVQTVLVSGRVLPPAEVELAARIDSPVLEVGVDEGDLVEAGTLLARLDATEAEAQLAQARAMLARAEAASGRSRRIAPAVAQQALTRTQVQLEESRRALEQAESLVSSGAWPQDRLDAARDAVTRARSAERSAQLELVATRGADRQAAAAAVDEAMAALTLADQRLAHTTIRAPVAGMVLERMLDAGDQARPGNTSFRLAAEGPPILSVEPDERHLSQLEVGQPAQVASDAYADRAFGAAVSFIAPSVDPERGTVEVRLLPSEDVDFLRPNMTISVEIEVAAEDDALVLPAELVFDAATDTPWVWVERGGRLARHEIELGLRGDELLQVTGGLEEGDLVLEVIAAALEAGDRVRVAP